MTDLAADPAVTEARTAELRLAELWAKQQITEVLHRRARAGDRRDVDLALTTTARRRTTRASTAPPRSSSATGP